MLMKLRFQMNHIQKIYLMMCKKPFHVRIRTCDIVKTLLIQNQKANPIEKENDNKFDWILSFDDQSLLRAQMKIFRMYENDTTKNKGEYYD